MFEAVGRKEGRLHQAQLSLLTHLRGCSLNRKLYYLLLPLNTTSANYVKLSCQYAKILITFLCNVMKYVRNHCIQIMFFVTQKTEEKLRFFYEILHTSYFLKRMFLY